MLMSQTKGNVVYNILYNDTSKICIQYVLLYLVESRYFLHVFDYFI